MLVKKILVILLLVMYSASTMGATIHVHYCMNKIAGWSFSSEKKDKCARCGMKNTGCCKDEQKQLKVASEQQKSSFNANLNFQVASPFSFFSEFNTNAAICINKFPIANLHAPPLLLKKHHPAFLACFLI
ncbi:MAG: hypothetical protein RL377_1186 [Bacteroidota bacterium]